MDKIIAKKVLLECLSTGGDYAEIYLEDKVENTIRMMTDKIDDITTNHLYGAGIRILLGNAEVYGYTNDVSEAGLMKLASELKTAYNSEVLVSDFDFNDTDVNVHTTFDVLSENIPNGEKVKYLEACCKAMKEYSPKIIQAVGSFSDETQYVTIANSYGVYKSDVRNHQRVGAVAVASDGKGMQQASNSYGGNFDISYYEKFDFATFATKVAESAVEALDAEEMVDLTKKYGVYAVTVHDAVYIS